MSICELEHPRHYIGCKEVRGTPLITYITLITDINMKCKKNLSYVNCLLNGGPIRGTPLIRYTSIIAKCLQNELLINGPLPNVFTDICHMWL